MMPTKVCGPKVDLCGSRGAIIIIPAATRSTVKRLIHGSRCTLLLMRAILNRFVTVHLTKVFPK
jgi:hypothetical protein